MLTSYVGTLYFDVRSNKEVNKAMKKRKERKYDKYIFKALLVGEGLIGATERLSEGLRDEVVEVSERAWRWGCVEAAAVKGHLEGVEQKGMLREDVVLAHGMKIVQEELKKKEVLYTFDEVSVALTAGQKERQGVVLGGYVLLEVAMGGIHEGLANLDY